MGSIELDRHFDSVAFWKDAYEKAEDAQSKLNDRIYDLEQRIESLKLKQDRKDVDELEKSAEKRKANSDCSVAKKRQKTTMIPGRQSSVTPVADQLDGVISNLVYEEASRSNSRETKEAYIRSD
jgi:predicted  nucleic acid-binding Zn-ribbon protein